MFEISFLIVFIMSVVLAGMFVLRTRMSMFLLASFDLLVGLVLMGLGQSGTIQFMFSKVPTAWAYYVGLAVMLKGIYSIALGFVKR
ncbi:MAG: hypothetical protein ABIG20_02050 [archaeon]